MCSARRNAAGAFLSMRQNMGAGMTRPDDPAPRIVGPGGRILTRETLPSPDTRRWSTFRKAEIIAAVRGGLISMEEACTRYRLTTDEFLSWQRLADRHGLQGLKVTLTQRYRHPSGR
jgi:Protein of unknown function (DUF1153)